jgi:hypothetical protein
MPSRLALLTFIAAAGLSQPCLAQKVVSTHPPLSPADAVSVLRSSHSLSDMANRPLINPDGPHIYVLPYDRSIDEPPPNAPPAPLSRDWMPFLYGAGYMDGGIPYAPFGGYAPFNNYAPLGGFAPFNGFNSFNGFMNSPRFPSRGHMRSFTGAPRPIPTPPRQPPRTNVIGAAPAGLPLQPR